MTSDPRAVRASLMNWPEKPFRQCYIRHESEETYQVLIHWQQQKSWLLSNHQSILV